MTAGSLSTVYKADRLQRTSSMIPPANNFDRATSCRPPSVDSSSQRNEAGEAVLLAKGLDLRYGSRASQVDSVSQPDVSGCCSWHGLAQLRMHTDQTLNIFDGVTAAIGAELRNSLLPDAGDAFPRSQHRQPLPLCPSYFFS